MGWHITTDGAPMLLAIDFRKIEDLRQCPSVQHVLQLRRTVLCIRRRIGSLPFFSVVGLPLALEVILPTAAGPELRLFEIHSLRAGIECPLDSDRQIVAVIHAGRDVGDIHAMLHQLAIAVLLRLVPVVLSVETAVEIILVLSPRHSGHHLDPVPTRTPAREVRRQPWIDAIGHYNIPVQVGTRRPRSMRLEAQSLVVASLLCRGDLLRSGNTAQQDEKRSQRDTSAQYFHVWIPSSIDLGQHAHPATGSVFNPALWRPSRRPSRTLRRSSCARSPLLSAASHSPEARLHNSSPCNC